MVGVVAPSGDATWALMNEHALCSGVRQQRTCMLLAASYCLCDFRRFSSEKPPCLYRSRRRYR
jgi:hypothetical protein